MPGDHVLLDALPADWRAGRFLGRVLTAAGPSPIMVDQGIAYDMSRVAPTVAQLVEIFPVDAQSGEALGPLDTLTLPLGPRVRLLRVLACGTRRGPAAEAAGLYLDLDAGALPEASGPPGETVPPRPDGPEHAS